MSTIEPLREDLAKEKEKNEDLEKKIEHSIKEIKSEKNTQTIMQKQFQVKLKVSDVKNFQDCFGSLNSVRSSPCNIQAKYTYDTLSFAFALLQELEKQRFDSVNKVQNRNEELEREKRQLEKQLKDLNAELDQQKVAQQRLGSNFYRPQTKFAKVMFLHVSVILSRGGGSAPLHAGIHTHLPWDQRQIPPPPGSRHPPEPEAGTPRADTPPDQRQVPPLGPDPPPDQRQAPPRADTPPRTRGRYPPPPWDQRQVHPPPPDNGQQAGGTHPTGMQSCTYFFPHMKTGQKFSRSPLDD